MGMIKYGVEHITKDEDRITMYNKKERAFEAAKELGASVSNGEGVLLFYADCDDDGKLATNEFNIVKVWA